MGEVVGMVLCAGLGTRLRPLTERVPKAAVPVCGIPLIRYNLALLAKGGAHRVVVNVHHLPEAMTEAAKASARVLGLELAISREPVIAGTGGALREARRWFAGADAIAVVNGDVLFDLDLAAVVRVHRGSGALATMVLMPMPSGASYAAVETDAQWSVRRIAGRFGPGGEVLRPWHFTGVHVLSPAMLEHVPAEPFQLDVNRDVYPALMAEGLVRGLVVERPWNDLGTPTQYLRAHEDVLAGRLTPAVLHGVDPFAGYDLFGHPGIWMAPGAHIETGAVLHAPAMVGAGALVEAGATVGPFAVVGAGAKIATGARLAHSVVWPSTSLAAGEELLGGVAAGHDRVNA